MRVSQPASTSTSEEGKHNRLGVKRKKHKRLDSISENVLNQNSGFGIEHGKETSRVESVGDDSELRRSSRMRRAPVILDVSPSPSKKRRKKFDVNGRRTPQGSGGRGTGQFKNERGGLGSGGWRSRLRSRDGSPHTQVKGNAGPLRGKRKLYKDLDEIEGELELLVGDGSGSMDGALNGRKSTTVKSKRPGRVRASMECETELHADADNGSQTVSVDEISVRANGTLVKSLKDDANMDDCAAQVTEKELEVGSCTHSGVKLIVDDDSNRDAQVDANTSQLLDKDIEVSGQLPLKENLTANIDANEERMDGGASKIVEKENEVGSDKHSKGNETEDSEQNYNTSGTTERKEGESDGKDIAELPDLPIEMNKVGSHIDRKISSSNLHREGDLEDKHAKQKGKYTTDSAAGIGKFHVKAGRRCGLCGGGADGKPPKRLIPGAGGSDHEAYSGSSESDETEYDLWDGFGEEPAWLGRLLGPISDRYGIAGIWVHQQCAVWSPEVYFAGLGCLKNIRAALCRGKALKCTRCGRPGATTGCRVDRCPKTYHLPCARAGRCIFDHRKFLIACTDHGHLFQPHGHHYLQRIKKLKAKKMKLELRKTSHEAWRKDHEAEEKWLEKCGEDEEFLKRESKRLQRDTLRIAPVYIGGPHSQGENVSKGWDSVAGLQDVIRCMKEVVMLPLLYPEFFDNMGLTPPRGVLLHGYPGTGKTLVVRALIGSIAQGDRRIAYFARKGADCLGKYVGDAERQLRLLFQAAEKSQPSIIFFDEIDGLAPVRTRQQDQTHSSVVSTLLALMDGLKSRGSVVVIGATNRPDAVDPALRRPGRFDREIYFPLPKVEDRAGILALHTRKWQKPLGGSLLQWVARQTAGFAGADLQALCTQAAMAALRRSFPLHKILSVAGERGFEGKCPRLPSFIVEERDWLEALSSGPPPCSRREAGVAASEIAGSPLHSYLAPHLLQPLSRILVSLSTDERIWLPPMLLQAGAAIKNVIVSALQEKNLCADKWWFHVQSMTNESETAYKIVTNLSDIGILTGEFAFAWKNTSNEVFDDVNARLGPCGRDNTLPSMENLCYGQRKEVGYRLLIAGKPRSGQKHIASCLLRCFVGNTEMQKIDMATIAQEGHGDVLQGITQILRKCASVKSCLLFMPRIDLWAIDMCGEVLLEESLSSTENPMSDDEHLDSESSLPKRDTSETGGMVDAEVVQCASQTWNCFAQQVEVICASSSLTILATSDLPYEALPPGVRQFFETGPSTSEGGGLSQHAVPRITVDLDGRFDLDSIIHSSASVVIGDLLRHFIQIAYHKSHPHQEPRILFKGENKDQNDIHYQTVDSGAAEETKDRHDSSKDDCQKMSPSSNSRIIKGKSSLSMAIACFGYQVLCYPHFAELCWVTSKLKGGPSADIHGPWKGWPFNSCIVRAANNPSEDASASISGTVKDKKQFSLVRGLIAVGLSAYRGVYTSLSEVSLEVRAVLELLVREVSTRVQAGKGRHQFITLLSQVAYLEDMVNSWVHSLRSLGLDAQSDAVKPKLTGPGLADNNQACNDGPPINLSENVCEAEVAQISADCTTVGNAEPAPFNGGMGVASDDVQEACALNGNVSEADPIQGTAQHTVIGNTEAATPYEGGNFADGDALEHPKAGDSTMKKGGISEPFISHHHEELMKQFDALTNMMPRVAGDLGTAGSSDNFNLSSTLPLLEKGASVGEAEPGINIDADFSLDQSTYPSEPGITCSYSCCSGCMKALHQLVEKVVSKELELTGGCETVDDVHDFVASLSSSLCSAVRRLYAGGSCKNVVQFEELDGCNCRMPESKALVARECICHSGTSNHTGVNSSLSSKFTFKDGILVPSDTEKVLPFHCIYENLCLCSLIELIVTSRRL